MNRSLLRAFILTATLALGTVATAMPLNTEMPVPPDPLRLGNLISNI